MVLEVVEISIKPGNEDDFEKGVAQAQALFRRAKGCEAMELKRSVERPSHYRLFVTWQHIDDHLIGFKNSPDIEEWRRLVGSFFASPPQIEHFVSAGEGFWSV